MMNLIRVLPPSVIVAIIASLIAFLWLLYTVLVMYHWFRYSPESRYAALVFAVHLFVSTILGIYAVSGFFV